MQAKVDKQLQENVAEQASSSEFKTIGALDDCDSGNLQVRGRKRLCLERELSDSTRWTEPFYFVQAADSQLGLIDRHFNESPDPNWDEEMRLSEEFIAVCNKMQPRPKFLVVCGDLVDAFPGTERRRRQVGDFKRIFAKLSPQIPLICVCGNHDVGDAPTMNGIIEYKRDFGDDYFYFITNGVLFIVINTQFYEHRDHCKEYAREQDKWLELILSKCRYFKYSIVLEHIPWFLQFFDEDDEYFNIRRDVRLTWLRKLQESGVSKILCGHYHRNAGGWYGDMELVVTSALGAALGDDKSGARLVKLLDKTIEHRYYELKDIPTKINLDIKNDPFVGGRSFVRRCFSQQ